jgi:hypothetical protein
MNADRSDDNPRLTIRGTDLERTLRFMEVLQDEYDLIIDEKIRNVLMLLGDCWPTGSRREGRGASLKQVRYVALLAGFDLDQVRGFCRVVNQVGGMDSRQAHHLINELLAARKTRTQER